MHNVTPADQAPLRNKSPGLALSDIKPAPNSTNQTVPPAPVSSAGTAGLEAKEEMIQMYLDTGQQIITPYYYKGVKLELSVLILTMQELHTVFRQEIQEFTTHQKDTLELEQFTEGLQLMDRVGRDYMRRCISYFIFYDTHLIKTVCHPS